MAAWNFGLAESTASYGLGKTYTFGKDLSSQMQNGMRIMSSTIVHPCGSVIASCSGQRHFEVDDYDFSETSIEGEDQSSMEKQRTIDNSLKLWLR